MCPVPMYRLGADILVDGLPAPNGWVNDMMLAWDRPELVARAGDRLTQAAGWAPANASAM